MSAETAKRPSLDDSPDEVKPLTSIVHIERDPDDYEPDQRPLNLKIIWRLLSYMRPYAKKRNWVTFLALSRSVQLAAVPVFIGWIIGNPIRHRDAHKMMIGVAAFVALVLLTEFMFHFRMRLAAELGEAIVHDLRNKVYAHLLAQPMSFYNRSKVGKLISRVTSDIDIVRSGVQNVLFISTVQAGQLVIASACMIYFDWRLFSVVLVMVPILWTIIRYFRGRLSRIYRATQESFSRVTATLAESVMGVKVTQGFVRQDINGGLFRTLIFNHSQLNMAGAQHMAVFQPLLEFNGQLFLSILLTVGGWQVLHGKVDLGDLLNCFFCANYVFGPIPILAGQYNQALSAMAGAERVFKLFDTPPEWTDAPDARPLPPCQGRVELENVTFSYVPGKSVLHGVSFVAEPGHSVALVGHTGSGKTTIINLIAKFYLPTDGKVLIDGHEIRTITGDSLHHQMGVVLQNNFLFSGTVLENIRIGKDGATEQDVREAARRLDVLDMLEDLPKGLLTEVGEKGGGLSVGQRQIICFARALIASPRIVILDEATSSIDGITEARLQKALETLLEGRTSFVIAHRLSTIRKADLVLVLDHGRIVERGKHTELLAKDGVYANLYRQFIRAGQAETDAEAV